MQYPHSGTWTIAFLTGTPGGDVANHLRGDYVSVYVPTTPNPTSGFFLMMPRADVIELDMSVDEALKYVISMGVAAPGTAAPQPDRRSPRPTPERRRKPARPDRFSDIPRFLNHAYRLLRTDRHDATSARPSPCAAGCIAAATMAA